jgi:hypothetical protein
MGLLYFLRRRCGWKEVNRSFGFNLYDYERNAEMQNEYVLVIVKHLIPVRYVVRMYRV